MPENIPTDEAGIVGTPSPDENQQDRLDPEEGQRIAREVAEYHRKGLAERRYRDLTAEKYLLHIDGEGDSQWADLYEGGRIVVPRTLDGTPRAQENLLRPIVDNAVAYHTTMPLQVVVESRADRASRESALFDELLGNHLIQKQRLNAVFAEAMYMAMPYGSCPVHGFWRNDLSSDPYQPFPGLKGIYPGFIDAFVGDPWDTVFDAGARRSSAYRMQYGRVLPADLVRRAFDRKDLRGSDRLPSASRFQRIARRWMMEGLAVHGTAALSGGEARDELIALICRETAPGIDTDYPGGRLTVVALQDAAATDQSDGKDSLGRAILLHDGPLPGGCFSAVQVYSSHRFDDILGSPFVAGALDDLQIRLNQALTDRDVYLRDALGSPLIDTGITDDSAYWGEHVRMEIDPGAQQIPRFLEHPLKQNQILNDVIEETREAMFRIGGYQAASRGEGSPGDSGKKVLALARADDSIHGPTNARFREAVEDYLGICWRLFKQYADVPWLIDVVGEEYSHLAGPYLDRTKVSERPPTYRLVSGQGATPDAKMQQLFSLVQSKGADGMPLLSTEQFKKSVPDRSLFPEEVTPLQIKRKRARDINTAIRTVADNLSQKLGDNALKFFQPAFQALMQKYPPKRDDDPRIHIDILSEITQDETENQLARILAEQRQAFYFQIIARAQAAMQQRQLQAGQPQGQQRPQQGTPGRKQLPSPADPGKSPTSRSLEIASEQNPNMMGAQ